SLTPGVQASAAVIRDAGRVVEVAGRTFQLLAPLIIVVVSLQYQVHLLKNQEPHDALSNLARLVTGTDAHLVHSNNYPRNPLSPSRVNGRARPGLGSCPVSIADLGSYTCSIPDSWLNQDEPGKRVYCRIVEVVLETIGPNLSPQARCPRTSLNELEY